MHVKEQEEECLKHEEWLQEKEALMKKNLEVIDAMREKLVELRKAHSKLYLEEVDAIYK